MKKHHSALSLLFLYFFHLFATAGCSGSQRLPAQNPPVLAVDVARVEVSLEGLPELQTPDASTEDQGILVSSGGANGEIIVPLARGATAPFPGVLFNGPAVARVSVQFRSQQERCTLDRQRDADLMTVRYNADTASLRLALDAQRRADQILLDSRSGDIQRLNNVISLQQRELSSPRIGEGFLWASGGLLVGGLIVGGIFLGLTARP